MKKATKKPIIDLLAKELINGERYYLQGIKLPKNGIVDIFEHANMIDIPIGKARVIVKYGKLIAQLEEIEESYFDMYLIASINIISINKYLIESSSINHLFLDSYKPIGSCGLTIQENIEQKNHIQDFFTVEMINDLCKTYNVGILEISAYTGIQYNSLYQYLGGEKSKPTLPLSKVVRSCLFLYFKAVFGWVY